MSVMCFLGLIVKLKFWSVVILGCEGYVNVIL